MEDCKDSMAIIGDFISGEMTSLAEFISCAAPSDLKSALQQLSEEYRESIQSAGGQILTCQHAFGGVGRAVRKKLGTYELEEVMAYTLRIFGEGTKVACEIALMAVDAGLVRTDEDAISIGGTGRGADTAIVLRPTNAQTFFDMRIREILCKPLL